MLSDFIARGNPGTTQRMGEALIQQAEAMMLFPQSGRVVSEKRDPLVREVIVGSYRVVYRIEEGSKTVVIARVWHGARGRRQL